MPDCRHPDVYWCPAAGDTECSACGGFDTCCARPRAHVQLAGLRPLAALLADAYANIRATAGPCGHCGGPDQRHRRGDAVTEQFVVGAPVPEIADLFEVPELAVAALTARTLAVEVWLARHRLPARAHGPALAAVWPKIRNR